MHCWIYWEYQTSWPLSNQARSLSNLSPQIQSTRRQTRRVVRDWNSCGWWHSSPSPGVRVAPSVSGNATCLQSAQCFVRQLCEISMPIHRMCYLSFSFDKWWCDSEGLTFFFGLRDLGNHRINNQRIPGSRGSVNSLPLISEHIQGLFFCLHTQLINLKRKLLLVKVVALKPLMWLASFDGNKRVGWENVTWCEIISPST